MKFARIGPPGVERPAVMDSTGRWRDLSALIHDIDPAFLAGDGRLAVSAALAADALPNLPPHGRFGSPVIRPGKIVCIGLNYAAHAAETGSPPPDEPVVFLKATNTLVGPDDEVLIPRGSQRTDYEIELAVVIGATARYLESPAEADAVIAGYCVVNDLSEREFQLDRGGQWDKGKSCETFNPLGPWLVTPDEVGGSAVLQLRLWVNGELRQDSTTADMIFDIPYLIWYLSQFMRLDPGDIINTGTPAGVALGANDFAYLVPGDVMELEISGLGRQRQRLAAA
jgi:2-keto-4-pentenoate hydratase/2-oxohepta-3-ene-1,7-dioic acid hydratase in catechol pathway